MACCVRACVPALCGQTLNGAINTKCMHKLYKYFHKTNFGFELSPAYMFPHTHNARLVSS